MKKTLSKQELIELLNNLETKGADTLQEKLRLNNEFTEKFRQITQIIENNHNNNKQKIEVTINKISELENYANKELDTLNNNLNEALKNESLVKELKIIEDEKAEQLEKMEKLKKTETVDKNDKLKSTEDNVAIDPKRLAHVCLRKTNEMDDLYGDLSGKEYVCKGRNNGCINGTLYGSNPYTTDSKYCTAALHGNLIDENGGIFHVKPLGSKTGYISSTSNGITSQSWQTWDGLSFHYTFRDDLIGEKFDYCGEYLG